MKHSLNITLGGQRFSQPNEIKENYRNKIYKQFKTLCDFFFLFRKLRYEKPYVKISGQSPVYIADL